MNIFFREIEKQEITSGSQEFLCPSYVQVVHDCHFPMKILFPIHQLHMNDQIHSLWIEYYKSQEMRLVQIVFASIVHVQAGF